MPKPTILICRYLEKVSRKALEKYQHILRTYVSGLNGLYALYQDDRLYYVDLATDLGDRLKAHLRDRHGQSWNSFSVYLTIGNSHMREMESLFLRIARPRENKVKGNLRKAENLHAKFRGDIHKHQRLERQELLGLPSNIGKSTRKAIKDKSLPVLAAFAKTSLHLRTKFKGKYLHARVLKSGVILFEGKRFNSPSLAAAAACNRPTCNDGHFGDMNAGRTNGSYWINCGRDTENKRYWEPFLSGAPTTLLSSPLRAG